MIIEKPSKGNKERTETRVRETKTVIKERENMYLLLVQTAMILNGQNHREFRSLKRMLLLV